ncbi:MAG: DinB family protein [Chloroflexi bacterium]|nr:DinB family protein [Chloroflexota bacterium]
MELASFVQSELDRVQRGTMRATDGLSPAELSWRPGPECNSIGIIIFHAARSEDQFVQTRIQGKPQVWESEKWHEKLNLPASERGSGYNAEQLAAFPVPPLKDLIAYGEAVRARTADFVKSATPGALDRVISSGPPFGDTTVGAMLGLVVVHLAQHVGEIAYLRGVQRGMNK